MSERKASSAITDGHYTDKILIRGYKISELMEKKSFSDVVFLAIFGKLPNKSESVLMNAILVSCIDHGVAPCAATSRITIGTAPEAFQGAIAAGVLTLGDLHGGAIENGAKMLQESLKRAKREKLSLEDMAKTIVHEHWVEGKIIFGIGHPIHKPHDPRTVKLFNLVEKEGYAKEHTKLMKAIEKCAEREYGRVLPINVDGAIAAVISDMGIDWRVGKGFFIMSRVAGLVAHTYEEIKRPVSNFIGVARRQIAYDGPEERPLE